MTNSTSIYFTIRGAWCYKVVAKQEDTHFTSSADKQINEKMLQLAPL